jgi:dethiobiotin synthase
MSVFVTGTDTEVGKTVASAMIMARYGRQTDLGYWKPIATGASTDRDVTTIQRLASSFGSIHPESYSFEPPVSPHLAARRARTTIDPNQVVTAFKNLRHSHPSRHFIVEGIGGLLVPITDDGYLLIDLIKTLKLPCVLITRSTLGTINHTLLSIEALRKRSVDIAGVIMNGPKDRENRSAIERFGKTVIVGEITTIDPLTPTSIALASRRFDRRAKLKKHLT